ncbi:MAG: hypothetical protein Q8S15_07940 [Erysipelotrichaceae bacterium]|nr:hypothetical protein [Erysipelotrichaceae bacterium]
MLKKDMNLLESYRQIQKARSEKTSPSVMYLGIVLFVALSLGIFSMKLVFDNLTLESKIVLIEEYINDPLVIRKLNEISIMQSNIKQLDSLKVEVISIIDVLDYIPRFDQDILQILFDNLPVDVSITKLSYVDSWISLEIIGNFASDSSNYALRLQRTEFFKDVIHEGYKYEDTSRKYTGNLKVQMKGGN